MDTNLKSIFKAYDVRGIYPDQINESIVKQIGIAYATINKPKVVAVGQDVRAHGADLKEALIDGLTSAGVDVVDIGVITTDQLYFAVGHYKYDGGISVTASHNPSEYNGLKFSERGGAPISSEGLIELREFSNKDAPASKSQPGTVSKKGIIDDYIKHVLAYAGEKPTTPVKLVVNANFGAVGRVVDILAERLNLELTRLNWEQDGSFPKGPPNPLLPENRDETIELIKATKPDFGVAWDADADRVFFFTGSGIFIPSCYIIALLAPEILKKHPGANIVHDLTTSWVMDEAIKDAGGKPVTGRTGHTFIKALMREVDAPFAGESSGHYYFRDCFYADNGILPLLLVLNLIKNTGKSLEQLVEPLMSAYVVSGEINFTVKDAPSVVASIEQEFSGQGQIDKTDGLVIESKEWRFSIRSSNTEPLLRLNAESKGQNSLNKLIGDITKLIDY